MSISAGWVLLFTSLCVVTAVRAEPVEIRQGDQIGAGYTFRRGATCTVVTVRHAVPYDGVEVRVSDRTGGSASGQRVYDNETYDLALIALSENSAVACTTGWPETGWIGKAKFTGKSTFEVVRHTPDDRETILPVSYVGGTSNTVTLAPVGKLKARVTFSGSIVRSGEDRLSANWTTYVNAWLRDQSGHTVMPAQDAKARCGIRLNVIDWTRENLPNPEYAELQQRYNSCGSLGIGGIVVVRQSPEAKANCQKQVRVKMTEAGRYLKGHHLTMEALLTPRDGAVESALETVTVAMPAAATASRTEEEMHVMQKAAGSLLTKLFETGVCD